ncbi:deoxyribose-phosphate aldolase [Algicella marina]|uniref:Deoxyribose-phosphate aldolase n=1 Tax=Algicella marina TaxID=2683284 RepID=A0A6P1SWH9_9RHOB|nr:deoxyribose-phosphate aldolase [Algicella marina]QHQ34010.1 deoxyribose-phosphate aldolase [Algicella marina]
MSDLQAAAARAMACLDLTNLNDDCTSEDIKALCQKANTRHGPTAAVCIWPQFVAEAHGHLLGTGIRIATVVNFPGGDDPAEEVLDLTEKAVADGADEIDMVIPYKALMEGHPQLVPALVSRVREAAGSARVKAILETGVLGDADLIRQACTGALEGGADFLKTSTGKVAVNATPVAGRILLEAIRESGEPVGFKPAGGVKNTADAAAYLDLCDEIMGPDWARPATFRIGASGVLTALLATLDGEDAPVETAGY